MVKNACIGAVKSTSPSNEPVGENIPGRVDGHIEWFIRAGSAPSFSPPVIATAVERNDPNTPNRRR